MATINVSNASQLNTALNNANSGDTIVLAQGDYGNVSINNKDFGAGVTITSANVNNPADFSGLTINNVDGLTIDNVLLDYNYSNGDQLHEQPFRITNSSNVKLINSEIDGDVSPNTSVGTAYGLVINDSTNVTLENTEIHTFFRGAVFERVDELNVIGNEIHSIRSDGMDYAQVSNVLIEDNYFHDFDAQQNTNDHRDMIQFWTTNTTAPSENVTIRGNNFDIGDGSWTESIFIHNERVTNEGAGQWMFYKNFVIEENTIYNAHYHGITVGATDGLTIRNNTVLQAVGDPNATGNAGRDYGVTVPHIHLIDRPINVTITGNVTNGITADYGLSGHDVTGNVIINPNNYDNYYTADSLNGGAPHSFVPIAGSIVDGVGADVDPVDPVDLVFINGGDRTNLSINNAETSSDETQQDTTDLSFINGGAHNLPNSGNHEVVETHVPDQELVYDDELDFIIDTNHDDDHSENGTHIDPFGLFIVNGKIRERSTSKNEDDNTPIEEASVGLFASVFGKITSEEETFVIESGPHSGTETSELTFFKSALNDTLDVVNVDFTSQSETVTSPDTQISDESLLQIEETANVDWQNFV